MIRVTVHRKFAVGSPSLSVLPRSGFKTFENAANAGMRLLADETRQPRQERVGEYVVTYSWDSGRVQREYYRPASDGTPEYLRSETAENEPGRAWADVPTAAKPWMSKRACTSRRACYLMDVPRESVS